MAYAHAHDGADIAFQGEAGVAGEAVSQVVPPLTEYSTDDARLDAVTAYSSFGVLPGAAASSISIPVVYIPH